jgi:alkylation response protein AidB-like acyl-CoA dehydrogenase
MAELTDRQRAIVALADDLAARFAARAAQHDCDGSFPFENYDDLHASGYLRLPIPRRFGGEGASVFDMVLAQEHLAHGDGATAMPVAMLVQLLGRLNEEQLWPEPLAEEICRTIVAEGGLVNSVITESELGSISRGGVPRTTATPVDGGWRINGHKRFASGGPALRFLVVGVTLPHGPNAPKGETASAIVRAGSPGMRIVPTWGQSLSLRSSGNDDVYFDDVFVPEAWLVGRRPIGAAAAPTQVPGLNGWNLAIAAVYLGIGQAAVDAACDYANSRTPSGLNGKPIAELNHIQQWIGEMGITLRAARAVLHDAARAWEAHPDRRARLGPEIASAKYLCTNGACAAAAMALRVAGGFSLTRDLPLERYFRDTRAGLFHPPQDDLALALVGRSALAERRDVPPSEGQRDAPRRD